MKRFFDLIISLLSLILFSPVFLIVSVMILIVDGGPVIFKQERVGKNNKPFMVYKFRTMKQGTGDVATEKLEHPEHKITSSGKFLRVTSLDELPQLFNIINGSMSLVGPRPLIPAERDIRELREKYGVYKVAPGITGLAQISGRDTITYQQKALLDKEYVDNMSIALDLKIIIKTIKSVIKREGIKEGANKPNN